MNEQYYVEVAGERYGPVNKEQLQQWAAEGRIVASSTLVIGDSNVRVPASQIPALAGRFSTPAAAAPVAAAAAAAPAASAGYQPPSYPGADYGYGQGVMPPNGYGAAQQQVWSGSGYAPAPALGVYDAPNDSGTGSMARLPPQLQGLNFGAFAIAFWWSIFNRSYIGLLCLVPYVGWVMPWVLLFKGNEWAWQNRRFDSVEQFREVQRAWAMWGVVAFIAGIILGIGYVILVIGMSANTENHLIGLPR